MARARTITTVAEAQAALHEIAERFGISLEELLDPYHCEGYFRRSELFRNVIDFFQQEQPGEAAAQGRLP